MTIAIGTVWPYGPLTTLKSLPSGVRIPPAVILAADSRWTIRKGMSETHEDIGTKLFQLGHNIGAVFAGDVNSGEQCAASLVKWLQRGRASIEKPALTVTRDIFRQVFAQSHVTPILRILLGTCDPRGKVGLWSFSSDNLFEPNPINGMCILAPSLDTEQAFIDGLTTVTEGAFSRGVSFDPEQGALWITVALNDHLLIPAVDPTVGGKIQCAVIDSRGYRQTHAVLMPDPTRPDRWRRLTPTDGQLRTWHPRAKKRTRR